MTAGFQSTRPVRGATDFREIPEDEEGISIHAPRAGRDHRADPRSRAADISIHAPRAGRDTGGGATCRAAGISIHAPRAGRDQAAVIEANRQRVFQSTRPVRGATLVSLLAAGHEYISIHAPRAGRDLRPMWTWVTGS